MTQSEEVYLPWREVYDDPTLWLIDPYTSADLRNGRLELSAPDQLNWDGERPKPDLQTVMVENGEPHLLAEDLSDPQLREQVDQLREYRGMSDYEQLKQSVNPLAGISPSIFVDRGGLILANIDAIFNLTGADGGYLLFRGGQNLIYASLNEGPGGTVQYLQFRLPKSFGYGMTPVRKSKLSGFNRDFLDKQWFRPTNGRDGSGDLVTNAKWMTEFIQVRADMSGTIPAERLAEDGRGLDLLTADALGANESLSDQLLIALFLIALQNLWPGGKLVVRCPTIDSELRADLIAICSFLFTHCSLFKPVADDPASASIYLVARGYRSREAAGSYIGLLERAYKAQQKGETIVRLLADREPEFDEQIRRHNDRFFRRQLLLLSPVVKLIVARQQKNRLAMSRTMDNVPRYQLSYATVYWNLLSGRPLVR